MFQFLFLGGSREGVRHFQENYAPEFYTIGDETYIKSYLGPNFVYYRYEKLSPTDAWKRIVKKFS